MKKYFFWSHIRSSTQSVSLIKQNVNISPNHELQFAKIIYEAEEIKSCRCMTKVALLMTFKKILVGNCAKVDNAKQ